MIQIIKANDKETEKLKKESTLSTLPTGLKNQGDFNQGTTRGGTPRVVVVIDGICTHYTLSNQSPELKLEKLLSEFLSIFLQKYSAKIIYALSELSYSSFWELKRLINIDDMSWIRKFIFKMETMDIISELNEESESNRAIRHFWKNEYPNSTGRTKLFFVNDFFKEIVNLFAEHIILKYLTKREYREIEARKMKFSNFIKAVESQLTFDRQKQAETLGYCYNCKKRILKSKVCGRDYHKVKVGLLCQQCVTKYPKEKLREWI